MHGNSYKFSSNKIYLYIKIIHSEYSEFCSATSAATIWRVKGDAHRGTSAATQVLNQQRLHRLQGVAAGLVEGVQVKLERLGLDEIRAGSRHKGLPDGNHGLAFGIEPGEFIQGPDVAPPGTAVHLSEPRSSRFQARVARAAADSGCTG